MFECLHWSFITMSSITLKEHLKKEKISQKLSELIILISELAKPISKEFHTRQHYSGTKNIHGDEQVALDVWADNLFCKKLKESDMVRTIASEEQEEIVEFVKSKGTFGITLDPLDGSSLIGVNLAVGSIIGIFDEGDVLEQGKKMDAAMYLLYGPLTVLVYTARKGVHEFVLGHDGVYTLQKENILIGNNKIYAPGGLRKDWFDNHKKWIDTLENRGYKLRFSGSFVADFHQILHKGGIFMYPAGKDFEYGKLRLLFEASPMALIMEQAGGAASSGKKRIRDIKPANLAEKTPLYIGDKKLIDELEERFK